jgi:hypothetical protein
MNGDRVEAGDDAPSGCVARCASRGESGVYLRFVVALWRGLSPRPLSGALRGLGPQSQ